MNLLITKLILFYKGRLHDDDPAAGPSGVSQRKKARLDPLPNGSNIAANGASNNTPPGALSGNYIS